MASRIDSPALTTPLTSTLVGLAPAPAVSAEAASVPFFSFLVTSLTAAPFPGYIFANWLINGNAVTQQTLSAYPIVMPSNISAVFVKAKRVRLRSTRSRQQRHGFRPG